MKGSPPYVDDDVKQPRSPPRTCQTHTGLRARIRVRVRVRVRTIFERGSGDRTRVDSVCDFEKVP